MKNKTFLAVLLLGSVGALQTASAAVTSFSRAAFQTALTGGTISEQNFDSLAPDTILTMLDGVTFGATAGSALVTDSFLTMTALNGLGSTSAGFFDQSERATFAFATPITAFAININTISAIDGDYSATLDIGGAVTSKFDVFPGQPVGQFIGFISDTPFSTVTIGAASGATSPNLAYTLDTLVYGEADVVAAVVPEPATLGFVASGFLALVCLKRKR